MRIVLISGSLPPDICGVGDYTYRLANILREKGIEVEIISRENWSLGKVYKIKEKILTKRPNLIHIQYPTAGFGHSLAPQLLSLTLPCIVTIHEVSQSHFLRKISYIPFFFRSRKIIFTNHFEKDFVLKFIPILAKKSVVIPIGSNIPSIDEPTERNLNEIAHFGLIRPKKGLEEVIKLAKLIKDSNKELKVRIIGKIEPRHKSYYEGLLHYSESLSLPIIWNIGLNNEEVAAILSKSKVAYLPFPDGASERRGSLLAALVNGMVVVTTHGLQTTSELKNIIIEVNSVEDAFYKINHLLLNQDQLSLFSFKSREYGRQLSWDFIAQKHIEIYTNLIKK